MYNGNEKVRRDLPSKRWNKRQNLRLKQYRNYKCSKMDEVFWVGKSDTFMLTQQIGKKGEPLNQAKKKKF